MEPIDSSSQLFSIPEAAEIIGCSYRTLYRYHDVGVIKFVSRQLSENRFQHGMTKLEIERLQTLMQPPTFTQTLVEFAQINHMTLSLVQYYVHYFNIKSYLRMHPERPYLPKGYYRKEDLTMITDYLYQKRSQAKYVNIQPDTTTIYNPKIHYSMYSLSKFINPKHPIATRSIARWTKQRLIPYQTDTNGKIYFTTTQAEWVKNHYQVVPDEMITHQEMADKLHISIQELSRFRQYYHLPATHILGVNHKFYSLKQQQAIMDKFYASNRKISEYRKSK